MEEDFVNVNVIQRWQQVVSAAKWALCWAECNDSQDNRRRIWNGLYFVVTCWGQVAGSERKPFMAWGGSPLPRSSIFIYASSPVERSEILVLSEPEWEVQLYFSCYTCVLSIWHLSAEDSGPKTKQHIVVSQKDDSGVKAVFKQQKIFHTQTGLRNCWKVFSFFPMVETLFFLYLSRISSSTEASLFYEGRMKKLR